MRLVAISINHTKAPVSIREKVAFSHNDTITANLELTALPHISGSVILSTCNRLEIYASMNASNSKEKLISFLTNFHKIKKDELLQYLDYYEEAEVTHHICKVASGLHSLVVGEPQILGQLKESYVLSKEQNTLSSELEKLFQHAFSVAKKIRTTTDIGKNPISIAYLGVKLSEKIFEDLSKQTALLIGSNEMIELSAKHLSTRGIKHIIIANRTSANAQKIIDKMSHISSEVISLKQLSEYFHLGDIVISSTASQLAIIGKGLVETSIKKRKRKPIFILDIAIPRDVEEQVANLDDVFLYTVDDLKQVISENEQNRKETKEFALEKIIELNQDFIHELEHKTHTDIIKSYHHSAQSLKTELVEEALKELNSKQANEVIIKLADQLTNKLIHSNLQNIKILSQEKVTQCTKCIPDIHIKTK